MNRTVRLLVLVALGWVLVPLLPPAGASAAAAAEEPPQWQAKVYPREGADDEPIEIRTTGGCPADAPNILGRVYGKGFPKDGTNVIGNTDAGVSQEGPFATGLFTSMKMFMFDQENPVPLEGVYRIVVTCRTPELPESHGDYVVAIRFTDPHHWVAAAPVSTVAGPRGEGGDSDASGDAGVSNDDDPTAAPSTGTEPSTGADPGDPGDPGDPTDPGTTPSDAAGGLGGAEGDAGSGASGAPESGPTAAATDVTGAATDGGLGTGGWALIGAGALVALLTLAGLLRRRPA